jgi:hypothetical protein
MESPHEHQQALLLSRIITNIEKLNEAVMMMNKSLQVCPLALQVPSKRSETDFFDIGGQYPEYERRAGRSDVQELPIERLIPLGRFVSTSLSCTHQLMVRDSYGEPTRTSLRTV